MRAPVPADPRPPAPAPSYRATTSRATRAWSAIGAATAQVSGTEASARVKRPGARRWVATATRPKPRARSSATASAGLGVLAE
ncbi:hypothetical protein [Streptomyces sp. NPDC058548]|uniref:hypothetical protein n=1 Tax=Streptomyces sp. NPDC058548 TaxID=3346545 RepID=UPI0036614117